MKNQEEREREMEGKGARNIEKNSLSYLVEMQR